MTSRARLVAATLAVLAAGVVARPATAVPDHANASATGEEHSHTHGPDGLDLDSRGRARVPAAFAVDTVLKAPWTAADHDGVSPPTSSPDSPDVPSLAGLPQFHAVYVYPADSKIGSRFAQFAAMFQADARQASAFLDQMYGRGLRWDDVIRPNGRRLLDITVIRSAYKSRQLATANQFNLVNQDIARVFPSSAYPNKKFVAWLDAGSQYCGQGSLYHDTRRQAGNYNELRTVGIVYRPYANDATTGGWCRGRTLLHEMGHNLGALQQVAPNAFDGAHCDDDDNDVMCYTSAATFDSGAARFDYRNDDYWDPGAQPGVNPVAGVAGQKLTWWAVNLNKFVCPTSSGGLADCTKANTSPGY